MKNTAHGILDILVVLMTIVIYGGLPAPGVARADVVEKQNPSNPTFKVTVSGPGGKVAFKGATNTAGIFATSNLSAGNYVVQFNSSNAAVKGVSSDSTRTRTGRDAKVSRAFRINPPGNRPASHRI